MDETPRLGESGGCVVGLLELAASAGEREKGVRSASMGLGDQLALAILAACFAEP
jgi:hypothetical protein